MAKEKRHVFSARTTGEGMRILNGLKARLGIGWDELVIGAVCAHYGLDRGVMAPPRVEKPPKVVKEPKAKKSLAKDKTETEEFIRAGKGQVGMGELAEMVE